MCKHIYVEPTPVPQSVGRSLILSDFHCVGVSGLLRSVRRPRDVIYFPKAMTNSFASFYKLKPNQTSFLIFSFVFVHPRPRKIFVLWSHRKWECHKSFHTCRKSSEDKKMNIKHENVTKVVRKVSAQPPSPIPWKVGQSLICCNV